MNTSLGVFRHEVAQTDLPRKTWTKRHPLSWSFVRLTNEALQLLALLKKAVCWHAALFFCFYFRYSFDRNVGLFAANWLAFLAMPTIREQVVDCFISCQRRVKQKFVSPRMRSSKLTGARRYFPIQDSNEKKIHWILRHCRLNMCDFKNKKRAQLSFVLYLLNSLPPGTVVMVTECAVPVPWLLKAVTWHRYVIPFHSPVSIAKLSIPE